MSLRGAFAATKQSPSNWETASQRALAATYMLDEERGRLSAIEPRSLLFS